MDMMTPSYLVQVRLSGCLGCLFLSDGNQAWIFGQCCLKAANTLRTSKKGFQGSVSFSGFGVAA